MSTPTLPPTSRDFDIHRAHVIERISTRALAEKHNLSQTRIRQLVHRVNNWLAAALPVKTELEREQEIRLAQHLAADQLAHQIDQLQQFWNGSSDPKYFRQQTRVILALARLGVIPGAIDSLAADCDCGIGVSPVVTREGEAPAEPSPAPAPSPPLATPQSAICNSQFAIATAPLPGDCSPLEPTPANTPSAPAVVSNATPCSQNDSESEVASELEEKQGLALLEQRLLTLLAELPLDDSEKRDSLEQTLRKIQSEQATLQIRLSPDLPGATFDLAPDATTSHEPAPA